MADIITNLVGQGLLSQEAAARLGQQISGMASPIATAGNNIGKDVIDAFHTNTRNVYTGSIVVTQPIYMGGAITAANRMAQIGEDLAANDVEARRQNVLYTVDNAYWLVVSLRNKQKTAKEFLSLVKKLDDDVAKMVKAGVATKADKLRVDVSVNTTEMTISQLSSGISVAKMALCELCGLPLKSDITLVDEGDRGITTSYDNIETTDTAYLARPELRMIRNTIDLSKQATKPCAFNIYAACGTDRWIHRDEPQPLQWFPEQILGCLERWSGSASADMELGRSGNTRSEHRKK